jgi:hypothetical protein
MSTGGVGIVEHEVAGLSAPDDHLLAGQEGKLGTGGDTGHHPKHQRRGSRGSELRLATVVQHGAVPQGRIGHRHVERERSTVHHRRAANRQGRADHGQHIDDLIGRLAVDMDVALDAGCVVLHGQSHARLCSPSPVDAQKLAFREGGGIILSDVTIQA